MSRVAVGAVDPTESYWTVAELIKRIRAHDFDQQEYEILMIAEALARDGRVCAIGRRVINGETTRIEWEAIPRHEWEGLRFTLSPRGRPHPGDAFREQRLAWTDVKFSERDLRGEWLDAAFSSPPAIYQGDITIPARAEIESGRATADAYTHSGFSGRPSKGKHLIDDEFSRRVGAGTALSSLADEAKALFDWFRQQHPTLARPTTKTIKENIRARYREWKAGRPDPPSIRRKQPEIIENR
jgi:hypothetical protein